MVLSYRVVSYSVALHDGVRRASTGRSVGKIFVDKMIVIVVVDVGFCLYCNEKCCNAVEYVRGTIRACYEVDRNEIRDGRCNAYTVARINEFANPLLAFICIQQKQSLTKFKFSSSISHSELAHSEL